MNGIIIAFSNLNTAGHIRDIAKRHGYNVIGVCSTVSGALSHSQTVSKGIIICGVSLKDGHSSEIINSMPHSCKAIVVSSQNQVDDCPKGANILTTPLSAASLVNAIRDLNRPEAKPETRVKKQVDRESMELVSEAKKILIATLRMTEQEAHRYIQKQSMNHKRTKEETALMIIRNLGKLN